MLPRHSEDVERREVSRLAPRFHIELRADAPNEFRPVAFRGKHPAQKKQIAGLHRFHIGAERLRRRREPDAKFFQPLLGARRPRPLAGYHLLFLREARAVITDKAPTAAVPSPIIRRESPCPMSPLSFRRAISSTPIGGWIWAGIALWSMHPTWIRWEQNFKHRLGHPGLQKRRSHH